MPTKNNKFKTHKKVQKKSSVEIIAYLPIIIAFGYVPLIVRAYIYDFPEVFFSKPWAYMESTLDFFLAYKSFAIIAMGIFSIIMVLASLPQKPFRKDKIFIPLLVYVGMALLSAIISPWRYLAFAGSYGVFESVLVIVVGYVAICISTYHFVSYDGIEGIKIILYGSIPGIIILLLIGFFQFLKMDIFRTELGKHILASQAIIDQIGDVNFKYIEGTVYSTLFSTNFVGFYTSIVSALFFCLIFAAKSTWQKVVCCIGFALTIICMYGSKTTTSWLTLVFMIFIGFLVWSFRKKKRGFLVLGCYVLIGVMGIVAIYSDTSIGLKARNTLGVGIENQYEFVVKSIETNDSGIDFTLNTGGVHIEFSNDESGINLICEDDKGNSLMVTPLSSDKKEFEVTLPEGYYQESFNVNYDNETTLIFVYLGGKDYYGSNIRWRFGKTEDTYVFVSPDMRQMKFPENPPYLNLFSPPLMNGRGNIWNYTIPLLPKHIILGSGANTYIMEYPQEDFITEVLLGDVRRLDTKPHSFYIQQWVENGLIATIGLLIFFCWYIVRSLKLLYKNSWKDERIMISFGCFVGVCGWLFAGLANDSNVCTSLPFWCIMAIGFAINEYMIEEQNHKNES